MSKTVNKFKLSAIMTGLLFAAGQAQAVDVIKNSDSISFSSLQYSHYQLTLIAPDKQRFTFKIEENSSITPENLGLNAFKEGQYKYELSPIINSGNLGSEVRSLDNPEITEEFKKNFSTHANLISGVFLVSNSAIVDSDAGENQNRDFNINDDLIVDGSACIGFDCVNGEAFGFDTIRLKENNLRIKFDDTSAAASFPNNDWQLTANDSANGGANKFSIDDITGGRTIFTVEAGAPNHSLYVDDGGRLGLGTSTPSVDVHVINGNTPTLRLQQDGSSGFAPQTWDVAGNETNFFVRDVTNGSSLPFRIRPGAPTSSLHIDGDGNVGVGTASPDWNLHVEGSGTVINQTESTSGAVQIRMKTDTENRRMVAVDSSDVVQSQLIFNNSEFQMAGPAVPANLYATFNATGLVVNGSISTTASGQVHPDYVFKDDYKLMPLPELKSFISKKHHLPEIPSEKEVAENGINMTAMQTLLLKKVEELTLYTIAQQELIEKMRFEIDALGSNK